jgi:YbgC/YbaW family acyl-CoA thioester hydrolase
MVAEFSQLRKVEFSETDMAGIVHFSNFLRWMESAEHAFLRSLGCSVHARDAEGVAGWPRVKVECEYFQPLRFEEAVEVILRVEEVRNRSVRYGFRIRRAGASADAACGAVIAVHARVDPASGRLEAVSIPDELRRKLVG